MRLVIVAVLGLVACAPSSKIAARAPSTSSDAPSNLVKSNVVRADYAGSAACARCHSDEHDAWQKSAMHNMTRSITTASLVLHAPFAGEVFTFKRDHARMTNDAGERYVTIENFSTGKSRSYRVTRVIGGRHREDYAGIEVSEPNANGKMLSNGAAHDERILPVSYVIAERAYRYKGYSVMTPERPELRPGAVWNRTCIFCHNTEPFVDTALSAIAPTAPAYQGEVLNTLLPAAQQRRYSVPDVEAFHRALDGEMQLLGAPMLTGNDPVELATQAIRAIRHKFEAKHLVELGIGCESCHGGSAEHVADPKKLPSFLPHGDAFTILPTATAQPMTRTEAINRTCARCHQVLFSAYPFTWEGGRRADKPPGGSHISSGEARDFLLGGCTSQLHCARCHDPHAADAEATKPIGNALCLECHQKYSTPEQLTAHSHHRANGAGSQCMSCHMPQKNMSLDMQLSRYHRIGSPTEKSRVEADRPLECALCHADKRVGELVHAMESWWGKSYDRNALNRLYGEMNAKVLPATISNGKAHEQAVAIYTLGKAGDKSVAPLIATQLINPYPIVRYYAKNALTSLLGAGTIDLHMDNEAIVAAAAKWLDSAGMKPLAAKPATAPATKRTSDEE